MIAPGFWSQIILAALVVVGVWNAFRKGMILGEAGDLFSSLLPKWVTYPIYDCPMCMAGVWGTAVWFYTGGDLAMWPLFVLALSGLLKLITVEWLNH